MKRIVAGLLVGACAGVVDVVPMVMQGITWDANCSAFSLWVVSGLMIAATDLKLKPVLKGIVIPMLVLLPSSFLIAWKEPASLIPILVMTTILGAISGTLIHKYTRLV